MTVYHFNNNINILNIKSYCEWLREKSWIITEENEIKDNDYSNIIFTKSWIPTQLYQTIRYFNN